MKIIFLALIGCFVVLNGYAQDVCPAYLGYKKQLDHLLKDNQVETNLSKRKVQYQQYHRLCQLIVVQLTECIRFQNRSVNSKNGLALHYLFAKYSYELGHIKQAVVEFNKCLNNPLSKKTTLFGNITYFDFIGRMLSQLSSAGTAEALSPTNGYYISAIYTGKGSGGLVLTFDKQNANYRFNERIPVDNIEKIISRSLTTANSINAGLAYKLSGDSAYQYKAPFFFIGGWLNTSEQNNPAEEAVLNTKVFRSGNYWVQSERSRTNRTCEFFMKTYHRLKQTYFNNFNPRDTIIPVYLVSGEYSMVNYNQFLDFCRKIHFQVGKRVAYYNPLDNSIVAWEASGGGSLIHELVHAMIHFDYPACPFWLNEGLASLNEQTDSMGNPMNNYKLTYIHALYNKYHRFLSISAIIKGEQLLSGVNSTSNRNDDLIRTVFDSYRRYFCKYLFDVYHASAIRSIYEQCRLNDSLKVGGQLSTVLKITGKNEHDLQLDFENYLLKQSDNTRDGLSVIYKKDFEKNDPEIIKYFSNIQAEPEFVDYYKKTNHLELPEKFLNLTIDPTRHLSPGGQSEVAYYSDADQVADSCEVFAVRVRDSVLYVVKFPRTGQWQGSKAEKVFFIRNDKTCNEFRNNLALVFEQKPDDDYIFYDNHRNVEYRSSTLAANNMYLKYHSYLDKFPMEKDFALHFLFVLPQQNDISTIYLRIYSNHSAVSQWVLKKVQAPY